MTSTTRRWNAQQFVRPISTISTETLMGLGRLEAVPGALDFDFDDDDTT
jgi:hypothetical protein